MMLCVASQKCLVISGALELLLVMLAARWVSEMRIIRS